MPAKTTLAFLAGGSQDPDRTIRVSEEWFLHVDAERIIAIATACRVASAIAGMTLTGLHQGASPAPDRVQANRNATH